MTVQVFRTQAFETTHENRVFDTLLSDLQRVWGDADDKVILLGNFYCQGSEIDAAVLKRNSITVIDFKDYGGKIHFSENDRWFADDVEVRGGNKRNPFHQVRTNRFAVLERIKELGNLPSGREPNLGHITGMVLFHKAIVFDDNQISGPISRWFHVVDFDHGAERLSQITSREIDLSNEDLDAIVSGFGIPKYTPVGAPIQLEPNSADEAPSALDDLPAPLTSSLDRINEFIDSDEQLLVISGMVGTGRELLIEPIVSKITAEGKSFTVLGPNRRYADRYPVEAQSIYSYAFAGNAKIEKDHIVYDLKANPDDKEHLYIVEDAHLIADSLFETEVFRYGSGQLLQDFLAFSDLKSGQRKIIFMGDPYQLGRGKPEESALSLERLEAKTGITPAFISLDFLLDGDQINIFTRHNVALANSIRQNLFNDLEIETDEDQCIAASDDKETKTNLIKSSLEADQNSLKFVAYSHADVGQFNAWVRKSVFNRDRELSVGDLIHIHSGVPYDEENELGGSVQIVTDRFAEITELLESAPPLVQPLRGRDKPITVHFLRVRARLVENGAEFQMLCLRDYLYADKPEIDTDTLLALRVSAETRFKKMISLSPQNQHDEERLKGDDATLRAEFFRKDPHLNAARIRFGYALTLHRAQGQSFPHVISNLDTGQGQTNAPYFRWLYTLFTLPEHRLNLSNIPHITPFTEARWDESRAMLNTSKPKDLIPYDSQSNKSVQIPEQFEFTDKELEAFYGHVETTLLPLGITVTSVQHHNYQEVYDFDGTDGASCKIRFHYNKHFKIGRILAAASNPEEMGEIVIKALTEGVDLKNDFQRQVHEFMRSKLLDSSISIRNVEHSPYKEVYYLGDGQDSAKVEMNYNNEQFVTSVALMSYSNARLQSQLRDILGVTNAS
jgi:hypothetical protein